MSFNWVEYLDLAYELVNIPTANPAGREAHQRAALSRAYYAAYKIALHTAQTRDHYAAASGGSVHRDLVDHFRASSDPQRRDIARNLARLLEYRRAADYNDSIAPKLIARDTAMGLQLATHLLAKLGQL